VVQLCNGKEDRIGRISRKISRTIRKSRWATRLSLCCARPLSQELKGEDYVMCGCIAHTNAITDLAAYKNK